MLLLIDDNMMSLCRMPAEIDHNILLLRSVVRLLPKLQSNANHNLHNFRKVGVLEQEFMLKGENFDETPAENLLAFSRTNDGTGGDSKTNVLLHSSKRKYEQVTEQDASGSE